MQADSPSDLPTASSRSHEDLRQRDERDAWRCARWARRIDLAHQTALAVGAWAKLLLLPGAFFAGIPQDLVPLIGELAR